MPCPRPIIELARAFAGVEVGDTVGVVAEDPAARVDVQAWCRMRGQEYAGSQIAEDGVPTYLVRRIS
jgi:TusA-related sulfurtransferase